MRVERVSAFCRHVTATQIVWHVTTDLSLQLATVHGDCNHTFDIQNGKGLLNMPASNFGAGRHDILYAALILLYMELEHALLCCDFIYLFDIDLTQMLNVYWSTLHYNRNPWASNPAVGYRTCEGLFGCTMHAQAANGRQSACSMAA